MQGKGAPFITAARNRRGLGGRKEGRELRIGTRQRKKFDEARGSSGLQVGIPIGKGGGALSDGEGD